MSVDKKGFWRTVRAYGNKDGDIIINTFDAFHEENVKRCEKMFHSVDEWSESDWGNALAGEVGELCNMIKKRRRGEDIPVEELAKEMADVFCYLDLLSEKLDIDLYEAIVNKFNEVSKKIGYDKVI